MQLNLKLVEYVNSDLFKTLEGACNANHLVISSLIDSFQKKLGVKGSIGEIGVRDGKFIFGLTTLLHEDEKAAAIDIFEDQVLNVDKSGFKDKSHGNPFAQHKDHFLRDERWHIISSDSLGLTIRNKLDLLDNCGSFRMFSIDGGHDPEHVINDINFVNDIVCSGSVLIIDDYYNEGFPGVHEGVLSYLSSYPKWKPLLYGHNKLMLCTHSFYPLYSKLRDEYCSAYKDLLLQSWKFNKFVTLAGTKFKNIAWIDSKVRELFTVGHSTNL